MLVFLLCTKIQHFTYSFHRQGELRCLFSDMYKEGNVIYAPSSYSQNIPNVFTMVLTSLGECSYERCEVKQAQEWEIRTCSPLAFYEAPVKHLREDTFFQKPRTLPRTT